MKKFNVDSKRYEKYSWTQFLDDMSKCMADSIEKVFNEFNNDLCKGLGLPTDKDLQYFLIGSGSNFKVYHCSWIKAQEIYKNLPCFYSTGSCVARSESLYSLIERYYAMESSSGYVNCICMVIKGGFEDVKNEKEI